MLDKTQSDPHPVEEGAPTANITVAEKWGGAVTPGSGFVAVPMSLLVLQSTYGLSATDMLVLINLLAHWWDPAKAAFPRSTTIARRMAVDTRTVQRSTSKLANSGLMTKVVLPDGKRGYDFRKLAARLANDLPAAYGIRREETHRG